ncbi:dTDP-4-dehydrorhamnose 3,5-epimerase family protein [Paraburkholderia sp. RL17-337-BIB-A]|uniref:dTDP-4-dehydrorhamnose 3,5-epimerase family protein n=1 Tax=Paraburkholderia sp. RL17-337-BIB-A TaxID=3031636 RepID=UPI0038BBDC21
MPTRGFRRSLGTGKSLSFSNNVLYGLHYQMQRPRGKLVRLVAGEVLDVAVNLRRRSTTFGRWVSARLSAVNCHQLWILRSTHLGKPLHFVTV